jgi:hypothetical protein
MATTKFKFGLGYTQMLHRRSKHLIMLPRLLWVQGLLSFRASRILRGGECHGLGRLGLHLGRAIDRLEAGLQKEPAQASEGEDLKCDGLHIETEPPSSISGFGLLCQSLSAAPPPTSHVISELVLSPVTPCPLILSPRLYLLLSNQRLSRI